ncbi:MAG TPA: hypothetical protein PKZ53_04585 [Acidobacteriota bacterium]|nr:hypothetical protein [Acidobacteriota bacterium]HNH83419.1 hypothetical protein [Acidobacteriota bacterium]HNJ39744.1 hypothetical protein [Acidobacteriota bacterium]
MSSEAIDQRLRDVAQLFRLGMTIQNIRVLGNAEELLAPPCSDVLDLPNSSPFDPE